MISVTASTMTYYFGAGNTVELLMASWLKSPQGIRTTSCLGGLMLGVLLKTIRWQEMDEGGLAFLQSSDKAAIIVNWHCRLLAIPAMLGRRFPTAYIISPSNDGQLISGTVSTLGIETIWGSRSKGAIAGYREMRRRLSAGKHVGITPDGPRGPARNAAAGAITLAQASGAPIIPVAWSTRRMPRLDTWDRLAIPGAFSTGIQCWGEPYHVPEGASPETLEQARLDLEDRINAITAKADRWSGHTPDDAEHRYGIGKEKRG